MGQGQVSTGAPHLLAQRQMGQGQVSPGAPHLLAQRHGTGTGLYRCTSFASTKTGDGDRYLQVHFVS